MWAAAGHTFLATFGFQLGTASQMLATSFNPNGSTLDPVRKWWPADNSAEVQPSFQSKRLSSIFGIIWIQASSMVKGMPWIKCSLVADIWLNGCKSGRTVGVSRWSGLS
ncbi:hypothetical protein C8R43DRAFT_940857 [Mycena crocata]|nr:hypothetical protein C8R43DRAFT_940857 [Mycena crocata]